MTGIPQRLPLSSGDREGRLDRLKREEFDLVVIGGGINGAGIARDAAMRGFRVALVEKGRFCERDQQQVIETHPRRNPLPADG